MPDKAQNWDEVAEWMGLFFYVLGTDQAIEFAGAWWLIHTSVPKKEQEEALHKAFEEVLHTREGQNVRN